MLGKPKFEFITGSAGTGKTWMVCKRRDEANGNVILAATTGIAAVNLGDATTINSALWYYDTKQLRENFESGRLDRAIHKLSIDRGIREIIIDEISLMSGEQLDLITRAIDFHNTYNENSQLSVTLVGDFLQLPVIKASFAFEAEEWPRYAANTTKLTKIMRQTDASFIEALLAARSGDGKTAAGFFKPYFEATVDNHFDGTTIMAKNIDVDKFNMMRMNELTTPEVKFVSSRHGKDLSEWKNIPNELILKPGALVMLLANKHIKLDEIYTEIEYVNGDLGHFIEKVNEDCALVRLMRDNSVHEIQVVTRKNETVENKYKKEIGSITYMPLRLAYASTVHKCVAASTRVPCVGQGAPKIDSVTPGNVLGGVTVLAKERVLQEAWTIISKKGYEVVTSSDHRWQTERGLVETKDLIVDADRIQLAIGTPISGTNIISEEIAWWLGAVVGDGNSSDVDDGTIHQACFDKDLGDKFAKIAINTLGYNKCSWRSDNRGLHASSVPIRKKLLAWGLGYETALSKKVPDVIWTSGWNAWIGFLRGLFDTDGTVRRSGVMFCTSSERLGKEVQELLLLLGIVSNRYHYFGEKRVYTQLYITKQEVFKFREFIGFWKKDRANKLEKLRNNNPSRRASAIDYWDKIKEVKHSKILVDMIDIEVESPHLVKFGPFVGHNCQGLTLDRIQINLRNPFFYAPGMVYVALSRARSTAGLRIVGNPHLMSSRCNIDPRVAKWL